MSVTLSVATSKDGYIDDLSSKRLILSTKEDWDSIYSLRSEADAILIGGNTLRSDNPSLTIKCEELKAKRLSRGEAIEPARVIISGRGDISPQHKIFHRGQGRIIIFSNRERAELAEMAEVIVSDSITAAFIVTELEHRGIFNIFVEGGERIHSLFFESGIVDRVRVASNPGVVVADSLAPRFTLPEWIKQCEKQEENLGGMEVETYLVKGDTTLLDSDFMEAAIQESLYSPKSEGCYSVGAIILTRSGGIFTGYTGEDNPLYHAEQAAIQKAIDGGAALQGATIYSTIEPCSTRSRQPKSCSQLIIEHGISRVCFALYEPSCFVKCIGAQHLREAGVRVDVMSSYSERVKEVNSHLLKKI
ncbi:MAG: dihydrofolate reductase family protein [Rikenellaceae bacterium]